MRLLKSFIYLAQRSDAADSIQSGVAMTTPYFRHTGVVVKWAESIENG